MIKAELSASLLQSSVSHDPSEIIPIHGFIINVGNRCAASCFLGRVPVISIFRIL